VKRRRCHSRVYYIGVAAGFRDNIVSSSAFVVLILWDGTVSPRPRSLHICDRTLQEAMIYLASLYYQ
jgi:hypothetical protein